MVNWSKTVSAGEAQRRAGGRRRYNAQRRTLALTRRLIVFVDVKMGRVSSINELAEKHGVSLSTAYRDYYYWFGKRRDVLAREARLAGRIAREIEAIRQRFERPPQKPIEPLPPVDEETLQLFEETLNAAENT